MRWVVGDGSTINVWRDPWLHDDGGLLHGGYFPNLDELVFKDLLMPGTKEWNTALLNTILKPLDVACILATPLHHDSMVDMRIWRFDKRGQYTVRSSYHLLMDTLAAESPLGLLGPWSSIWKLKVPPKVRVL